MRYWWNDWGWAASITMAIVVGMIALVIWDAVDVSNRIAEGRLGDTEHKILATEISRLHDDVRVLQTQVGPKQ